MINKKHNKYGAKFYQDCRVTILQHHKPIRCQMKICGQIHLHPTTSSWHLNPLTLTKALTHTPTTTTTKLTNHRDNPQTKSYITPQSHIQAILNKVIMEKAPEHQAIHLMTSIQLSTPHKPVNQTNHNTRSTYQPFHTL